VPGETVMPEPSQDSLVGRLTRVLVLPIVRALGSLKRVSSGW